MPLIETLPAPLEKALGAPNGRADDLVVAVATDLTPRGAFGDEWLVVTKDRLLVYASDGERPLPRLDLPLADLKAPATELLVGGGALQATVNGEAVELIRYTNARQRTFSRVAKYLTDVAAAREAQDRGEEVPEEPSLPEDPDEPKRCPQCRLLLPGGTKVCPACLNKGKVLRRLVVYLHPYWRQTLAVWTLIIASSLINLIPPYLNRPLMDEVLVPQQHRLMLSQRFTWLGWLVAGLMISQALGQAVSLVRGRLVAFLGARLSHDLRTQLYQHLQLLSLRFFDKRQTGAVMTRVNQDTQELQGTLMDGAQFFVVNILTLIGISIVLFVMNWKLALLIFIPAPFVALMSRYFWERMFRTWHRYWYFRQQLGAFLNDSLSGIRVVRAFAQECQEVGRFTGRSEAVYQAGMSAEQMWSTYWPMIPYIMGLGTLIVWYVGGRQVIGARMTLGMLMTFLAYLGMFYGPMQFLSRLADWFARALASAERIFEIIDSDPDVPDAPDAVSLPRIAGRVQFRDVTFGCDAHKPVLRGISLDVQPGEMIGLVGASGAGKSTTINPGALWAHAASMT